MLDTPMAWYYLGMEKLTLEQIEAIHFALTFTYWMHKQTQYAEQYQTLDKMCVKQLNERSFA